MKNQDVAEIFATSEKQVKTKHLFIDNRAIYSYGYHFKIAEKIDDKTALFTTRGYSQTTSLHKGRVRRALLKAGYSIIEKEL